MIDIVLADDDPIIVDGLSMIIENDERINIVRRAGNGKEAIKLCREMRPDVAVLDICMPEMDGIDAAKVMIDEQSSKPLLLTTFDEANLIDRALDTGVRGFIVKSSPVEAILSSIMTVAKGGTVFDPDVMEYIRNNRKMTKTVFFDDLTKREKEIVEYIAEGLSNREISEKLFLSDGTVRNYISNILEKKDLKHRTQIAVKYYNG